MRLSRLFALPLVAVAAACGSSTSPGTVDAGVFRATTTGDWALQLIGTANFVIDLTDVQNQLPHFRIVGLDTTGASTQPYTMSIERYGWRPTPGTYSLGPPPADFAGRIGNATDGQVPITAGTMTVSQSSDTRLVASFSFSAQRAASGTQPAVTLNVSGAYAAVCAALQSTQSCATGP